jgi:hypothetical protein
MNVILHYLEELEKGGGGVDPWKSIASLHSLDGFHIENRNVRDTIGIWMWSKPFVFKQSNGQEIAILLMDTQGVFDKFSTKREWAMIVGLSLLTSSCLIYNLQNILQEDNLEIFTNFAEFGMLSLQGNENATSVFQKLLFLIRDWGFLNDNPYGSVGGSTFIHEQLKVSLRCLRSFGKFGRRLQPYLKRLIASSCPIRNSTISPFEMGCILDLSVPFLRFANFVYDKMRRDS